MPRPQRDSAGNRRPTNAASPNLTLPRDFVHQILVRATVPTLLRHEAINLATSADDVDPVADGLGEDLTMYAVDAGAATAKTPEAALRALLGFWLAGFRPGDDR